MTSELPDWRQRWSDRVVAFFALLIPLFVIVGAKDTFRVPKDALFRAEAIVLGGLFVAAAIVEMPQRWRVDWRRPHVALPLVIAGWTAITALASTNRARSIDSLVTVLAAVLIFFATVGFARRHGVRSLFLIVIPAVVNAFLGAIQELDIWQPFGAPEHVTHHQRSTALIGNPNDAGGYIAVVAVAALAASIAARQWRRAFVAAAIVLPIGLLINQTLTAIIAFAAAALLMIAMQSWRRALIAAAVTVVIVAIAIGGLTPLRERAALMRDWLRTGNYNALLTNRGTAFVAATMMVRDHPFTGVGPGVFAWQYFPYKIEAEKRFPSLRTSYNSETNFSEVHSDHLQVAAETGAPGYLIFLATITTLAMLSRRRDDDAGTGDLARLLAMPLAVEFFILAMAQFPLELTAVLSPLIFLAACCAAWVER